MYVYYVVAARKDLVLFRSIVRTEHNMDTEAGFIKANELIEAEFGGEVCILNWRYLSQVLS